MPAGATELQRKLISRIEREGPITFRDFMEAALYDPELGYYNTSRLKIGPAGDYYTSSNVHPAFGAVLSGAFVELWSGLRQSAAERSPVDREQPKFALVEMGAGTGQLAFDVLSAIRGEHRRVFDRLRYVIVETSAAMRSLQRQKLVEFGDRIEWRELSELEGEPISAIVFSNELVDAMPVHRVRKLQGKLEELFVVAGEPCRVGERAEQPQLLLGRGDSERGTENYLGSLWDRPSSSEIERYLDRFGVTLREGQQIEVNLEALRLIRRVAAALGRGFLVTVDYGDVAAHLYGPDRGGGTLRCFYRHSLVDSPLERVGEMDITSSVNFTALIEYGRECGLELVSYERQTAFLVRMGLIARITAMEESAAGSLNDLKKRLQIKNLFVPGGISDNFRVLIQRKG